MSTAQPTQRTVLIDDALADQIIAQLDQVETDIDAIRRAVLTFMNTQAPRPLAADVARSSAPRVWDTSFDALDAYDAQSLVDLRADHRADNHDPFECAVCTVLARRLGSL